MMSSGVRSTFSQPQLEAPAARINKVMVDVVIGFAVTAAEDGRLRVRPSVQYSRIAFGMNPKRDAPLRFGT